MTGSCVRGNEPLDSIKCGEFLDYLRILLSYSRTNILSGVYEYVDGLFSLL